MKNQRTFSCKNDIHGCFFFWNSASLFSTFRNYITIFYYHLFIVLLFLIPGQSRQQFHGKQVSWPLIHINNRFLIDIPLSLFPYSSRKFQSLWRRNLFWTTTCARSCVNKIGILKLPKEHLVPLKYFFPKWTYQYVQVFNMY